jgi:hypothetical protein
MVLAVGIGAPAEPAATTVVTAKSAEHVMNLVDERARLRQGIGRAGAPMQFEKIADRESVGPQIALRAPRWRRKAGAAGEIGHQAGRDLWSTVGTHNVLPHDYDAPCRAITEIGQFIPILD